MNDDTSTRPTGPIPTSLKVPPSKSLLNRMLIIDSFSPTTDPAKPLYKNEADDVRRLRESLATLRAGGTEFDVGSGGTTLRFLAVRLSRERAVFRLKGAQRLWSRPQRGLFDLLASLDARTRMNGATLEMESQGMWPTSGTLNVDRGMSSQFLSALLLSSFDLKAPIDVELRGMGENAPGSESYLKLTEALLRRHGLETTREGVRLRLPAGAKPVPDAALRTEILREADASSAFAIAANAVWSNSGATIENYAVLPEALAQPDRAALPLLRRMGLPVELRGSALTVSPAKHYDGLEADLSQAIDLFPVLAALLARAGGPSRLTGLRNLAYKESHRLERIAELLTKSRAKLERVGDDACTITPIVGMARPFDFDPDEDHRMAMAAGLLARTGVPVRVSRPGVVDKSYPGFWDTVARL